jgi:hypothetical protein
MFVDIGLGLGQLTSLTGVLAKKPEVGSPHKTFDLL